jgi:hypothetical protein
MRGGVTEIRREKQKAFLRVTPWSLVKLRVTPLRFNV